MTYELTLFFLVVAAATLTALTAGGEPRLPVALKRPGGRLASRTVRVAALTVLSAALVAAAALGVLRWRSHDALERGAQLLAEGNAKEAVRVLVNVLAARPNDARAHYYLGTAYARLGVFPAASTHLKDAVRLAPHEVEHRVALAGTLIDAKEVEGAVEQLRRAAEARPSSPEIRLLLAMTLKLAGERGQMLRELGEVMRLAPTGALGEIARQETRAVAGRADRSVSAPRIRGERHLAGGNGHE